MGKKSPPKPTIEDRPEGTQDEDILWLRNDLQWPYRDIAQALGVTIWAVQTTVKRHSHAGRPS